MEILAPIVSFILLLALITFPILLYIRIKKWHRLKFHFLIYLISALIITAAIIWTYAWWSDYSDQLIMNNYGYDVNAMNDTEKFQNVNKKDLQKVKEIEIEQFGIGWPLKAFWSFVFYSPYLLLVYLIGQVMRSSKNE